MKHRQKVQFSFIKKEFTNVHCTHNKLLQHETHYDINSHTDTDLSCHYCIVTCLKDQLKIYELIENMMI